MAVGSTVIPKRIARRLPLPPTLYPPEAVKVAIYSIMMDLARLSYSPPAPVRSERLCTVTPESMRGDGVSERAMTINFVFGCRPSPSPTDVLSLTKKVVSTRSLTYLFCMDHLAIGL